MKNSVVSGDHVVLTAPADLASGQARLIGGLFVVAAQAIANGARGTFCTKGVFTLPKAAISTSEGEKAYWDATAAKVTDVSTDNTEIGHFVEAVGTGVATVNVRIR